MKAVKLPGRRVRPKVNPESQTQYLMTVNWNGEIYTRFYPINEIRRVISGQLFDILGIRLIVTSETGSVSMTEIPKDRYHELLSTNTQCRENTSTPIPLKSTGSS